MGTGIVSILLYELPYNGRGLYWLSAVTFCWNIFLFFLASLVSLLRHVFWPEMWTLMMRHPSQSLFLAAAPMVRGTEYQARVVLMEKARTWHHYPDGRLHMLTGVRELGGLYRLGGGLWMADAIVSIVIACCLPFILIKQMEDRELSSFTALDLFFIVAAPVASAVGATVAGVLPNPQHARATIIASYILWGVGIPAAMIIMVIYFQRLAMHKLPPRDVIVSVFLPLGPPSLGGYAVMQLGKVAMDVSPTTPYDSRVGRCDIGQPWCLYCSHLLGALVSHGCSSPWRQSITLGEYHST